MAWQQQPKTFVPSVLIGVPQRNQFTYNDCWRGLTLLSKPPRTDVSLEVGRPLDITRNLMVSRCLSGEYDYLFFVDDDIVLEEDTLLRLLHARASVVSGVYFGRAPPHVAVMAFDNHALPSSEFGKDELIEVHEVGMGCCLVHKDVFKKIMVDEKLTFRCLSNHKAETGKTTYSVPTETAVHDGYRCHYCNEFLVANFFVHEHGKSDKDGSVSEDYYFCQLARKVGYKVVVKADVFVGHVINAIVTKDGVL